MENDIVVSRTPQDLIRKKLSRTHIAIAALLMGALGTYALINSFAATSCAPDLDHLTAAGCPVVKSDTAASGDPSVIEGLWGQIGCVDNTRLQQITTDGDTHLTASGAAQGNTSYYKATVIDGDDFYGERCELGRNERRYGENGGAGTFQLYQEGQHKITFMSIRLPANLPTNVQAWQTIMQMKQTQPTYTAGSSPILEMQEYGNLFRIESDPGGELWTTSAVAGQWVRFAFDVTYSQDNTKGKLKVYVDKNGDGDTLDAGEQSPTITTATLATETDPSTGPGPVLQTGDPVPGHLRLGLYHNPSYSCPAPAGCSTDDDNVQVVDLTNVTTTSPPPPDTTAPAITMTAPTSGSTVSGTTTLSATASDDTGVVGVQFELDGNNLGSEDTGSPYSMNWDTTGVSNGTHTLTAVARDAAGNTKTSSNVSVVVANGTGFIFQDDFEAGNFNKWYVQALPNKVTLGSGGAYQGTKYAHFEVDQGDVEPDTGSSRAELTGPTFDEGQDLYIRDAIRVPNGITFSGNWELIHQLHETNWGGSPGIAIFLNPGPTFNLRNGAGSPNFWQSPTLQTNKWYDVVYHVKLSQDPSVGYVQVWLDGVPQTLLNGQTTMYGKTIQTSQTYLKVGIYRSSTSTGTSLIDHDNVIVGTTYASVAGAAPAPDTTPPSVPSNLKATAASSSQVNVSWNASTDSGSGVAGYNVYRNGTKINSSVIGTNSYVDNGVSANTTYTYKVEAVDETGNKSAQTAEVSVSTPRAVRGDITGPNGVPDGTIDLLDVSYLIRNYNTTDHRADITGPSGTPDGKVDIYDMSFLVRNYEP